MDVMASLLLRPVSTVRAFNTGAAGTTVLVTTHYLDEAEYCDRLSIMVDGAIAAMGTPGEVKASFGAASLDDVFLRLTRPGAA